MRKILALFLLLVSLPVSAQERGAQTNQYYNGRYQVIMGAGPTILLDTKTGVTWRNVKCGNTSTYNGTPLQMLEKQDQELRNNPANCWQKMDYLDLTPKP